MPSSNNVRKVTSENYPTDAGREGELIFRLVYHQCGCKKPEPKQGWDCPNCGTRGIQSKFCPECGCKKPEASTWTCPECGTQNITSKFCPECGDPFDDSDLT